MSDESTVDSERLLLSAPKPSQMSLQSSSIPLSTPWNRVDDIEAAEDVSFVDYLPPRTQQLGPDTVTGGAIEASYTLSPDPPAFAPQVLNTPHIAVCFTKEDHDPWRGGFCVSFYLSVWIASCLVTPVTLLFFLYGFYKTATVLTVSILLCYILPLKPSPAFRSLVRRNLGRYFHEVSVRFEHVPDPHLDRPTILCVHPHGVFSLAWALCCLTEELHHVYWCFSTLLRLSPYLRVVTELTAHLSNVKRATIRRHMACQRSLALIPGGWHEATIHHQSVDRVYLKQRQGFIKYALEFGYTLTPVYAFGERATYSNLQGCYPFRFWLNSHGILGIVPWGRCCCPLLPRPVCLHVVVGAPLQLPHIPEPTREDVNRWHQAYIRSVCDIFDRHKVQFYGPEAAHTQLEVW